MPQQQEEDINKIPNMDVKQDPVLQRELTQSSALSEDTLRDQQQEKEKSYFTSIEMSNNNKPSNAATVHTPSPLKQQHIDTEKWECNDRHSSTANTTHIPENTVPSVTPPMPFLEEHNDDTSEEGDIDDDKDRDFDWDNDDDKPGKREEPGINRHIHSVKRIKGMYRKYCCWPYLSQFMKRVVIAVIGSTIFITVGVCVYIYVPRPSEEDLANPEFTNIRANVQVWMYWAAFMWHIAWIITFMIEAVPVVVYKWVKFFRGRRSEKVKSYMEYYMSLKLYIGLAIITAINWGTWAYLINIPYSSVLKQNYTIILWRVFACLFVASVLLFVQKTIVQIIASRFHRFAFKDRITENRRAIKILDTLGKSQYRGLLSGIRHRKGTSTPRPEFLTTRSSADINVVAEGYSTSVAATSHYAATTSDMGTTINPRNSYSRQPSSSGDLFYSFRKNLRKAVLSDQPHLNRHLKDDMDINSDDHARKNAKKLYTALAYPNGVETYNKEEGEGRRCLLISDFEPYFKSAEEAKKAFELFDRDGNGDITRREFRDTVLFVYRERKDISVSMRDTSQALGKIDYMLLGVSFVALLFTSFAIFNVEVWRSLVPLGSLLLALTFVFGNTAKNTFESVLFLFVTHPYDAGDYVLIDGEYLLVHNLGVMGTSFISSDGQLVYAPTTVLMNKLITNVRRSGSTGETVRINVDFRTTTDQFWELHDRLSTWVASQSRDFNASGFDVRVGDIIDVNQMIINIWLPHKGNWQELGKRFKRKTRFMLALKEIMMDLDIKYELPAQRITQSVYRDGSTPPPVFDISRDTTPVPQSFSSSSSAASSSRSKGPLIDAKALADVRRERRRRERYSNNLIAGGE